MERCAAFLSALLLLSAASRSAAQTVGYVFNEAHTPLTLVPQPNGTSNLYETGIALERFDGAQWLELLRANGQRAVLKQGECWQVPDRSRAGGYRARPQIYDAQAGTVARPIDCANPEPPYAAPACPMVNTTNPPPPGSRSCVTFVALVDPGPAPLWRGPRAPGIRP